MFDDQRHLHLIKRLEKNVFQITGQFESFERKPTDQPMMIIITSNQRLTFLPNDDDPVIDDVCNDDSCVETYYIVSLKEKESKLLDISQYQFF